MAITVFWHRRDLRLHDNAGLFAALREKGVQSAPVQPIFIFDPDILDKLEAKKEIRVAFIHQSIDALNRKLCELGSGLWVFYGKPQKIFAELMQKHSIHSVYTNHDYEPAAISRDEKVRELCQKKGVEFKSFKDQVIFEKDEVVTESRKPYTVFTPYKKKWLQSLSDFYLSSYPTEKYLHGLAQAQSKTLAPWIKLEELGFSDSSISYPPPILSTQVLKKYSQMRDSPAADATSHLGVHLRFGTVSVRELARKAFRSSAAGAKTWLSELIWREFFMQILFHYPHVEKTSFRPQYEKIAWRENAEEWRRWCEGMTGYPLVDAGLRQLNETGFMPNRVRMAVASFLCKHLLMHWRLGERYFAARLLDFELSSNNGNWQWAAGTGGDAAPYFRVFNPLLQAQRFDPNEEYVRRWIPELGSSRYPAPMVDHKMARLRAIHEFSRALKGNK